MTAGGLGILPMSTLLQQVQERLSGEDLGGSTHRKRLRELGIIIGDLAPGPWNAITDVGGIRVGQTTIIHDEGKAAIRTGVTAIFPNGGRILEENLFAAYFSQNGWGEMTGVAPIEETGRLRSPVFLTGTYNVGIVYRAASDYLASQIKKKGLSRIPAPVVAECFDAFLSDAERRMITDEDVLQAIQEAKSGPVEEGVVGGGTGMTTFGFKGGIGTSSRCVSIGREKYTVGVLVMANTAGRNQLRIDGVPVGREIRGFEIRQGKSKSIILIAATDAPLLPYQLKKIAKRVIMGLAQTGATSHTESGDIILAFSTANKLPSIGPDPFRHLAAVNDFWISSLYQGTVEATQEAILNALTSASTVVGTNGNTAFGLPLDQVEKIMKKYHRIKDPN